MLGADTGEDPDDDGGARQLTTLTGWRAFVAKRPEIPRLLPDDEWRALGADARYDYDETRLAHHARLLVVATPTIQQVIVEGRRLQYLNRHAQVGRCGLILSGPARTGKTTCLTQLGKTIQTMHTRRHPHRDRPPELRLRYIPRVPDRGRGRLVRRGAPVDAALADCRWHDLRILADGGVSWVDLSRARS